MNKVIEITIRNKVARIASSPIIVGKNKDYIVRFNFDEDWDKYDTKTARFSQDEQYQDIIFAGNECSMPALDGGKVVEIGVYAGDISTTTPAYLKVHKSIIDDDGVPADPTPDVYAQLMERLNELEAPAAVLYTEQNLTDKQKAQARDNIGVTETGSGVDISLGIRGASAGQAPAVKSVDESGVPTEWEAVEFPEQVQSDWEQNDNSAKDYIKNRPFYDATETTDISGTFVTIAASGSSDTHDFIPLQVGQEWKVTTNTGSEFTVVVQENEQGEPCLGSPDTTSGSYPFYIRANEAVCNISWVLMQNITSLTVTCLSGTYTQIVTKKIDPKFLPDVGSSLVVNLTMDDSGNINADKTFAEIKAACDDGKVVDAKFEDAIVPLQLLIDSEAVFALTNAFSDAVVTVIFTCTSDNVWSMSQDGFDANTLGISGASIGQIAKIKTVDENGVPTEWEAADGDGGSKPFVVTVTCGDDDTLTADKTHAEIVEAYAAGAQINAKIVNYPGVIVPSILPLYVNNSDERFIFSGSGVLDGRAMAMTAQDFIGSWSVSLTELATPDDIPSGGIDTSLGITGASAGQVPVVKSVDENGVPNGWGAKDLPSGGSNAYDIDLNREPDLVIDVSEAINPSLSISEINGVNLDVTKMAVLLEYPSGGNYTPNYIRWNNIIKNAVDSTAILGNFNVASFTDASNAGALLAKIKKINNKTYECEYRWLRQNPGTITGAANNVCSNIYRNNFDGNTSIKELYIYQSATIPAGSKISIWVGET